MYSRGGRTGRGDRRGGFFSNGSGAGSPSSRAALSETRSTPASSSDSHDEASDENTTNFKMELVESKSLINGNIDAADLGEGADPDSRSPMTLHAAVDSRLTSEESESSPDNSPPPARRGRGGRPRKNRGVGRGRGRGRGASPGTPSLSQLASATPGGTDSEVAPRPTKGPGSRGGKGAYKTRGKVAAAQRNMFNHDAFNDDRAAQLEKNDDRPKGEFRLPDYRDIEVPDHDLATRIRTLRLRIMKRKGLTTEILINRRNYLKDSYDDVRRFVLGHDLRECERSLREADVPTAHFQATELYKRLLPELQMYEHRRMAMINYRAELDYNQLDIHTKGTLYNADRCALIIIEEAADKAIRSYLSDHQTMDVMWAINDQYLHKRILQVTGLDDVRKVRIEDLWQYYIPDAGRNRTPFDKPQIATRSNQGLYDRTVMETKEAELRRKCGATWAFLMGQMETESVDKSDLPEEGGKGTIEDVEMLPPPGEQQGPGSDQVNMSKKRPAPDQDVPDDYQKWLRENDDGSDSGLSDMNMDDDPELQETYKYGSLLYEKVRDWGTDLNNPVQYTRKRTARELDAIEALMLMNPPENQSYNQCSSYERNALPSLESGLASKPRMSPPSEDVHKKETESAAEVHREVNSAVQVEFKEIIDTDATETPSDALLDVANSMEVDEKPATETNDHEDTIQPAMEPVDEEKHDSPEPAPKIEEICVKINGPSEVTVQDTHDDMDIGPAPAPLSPGRGLEPSLEKSPVDGASNGEPVLESRTGVVIQAADEVIELARLNGSSGSDEHVQNVEQRQTPVPVREEQQISLQPPPQISIVRRLALAPLQPHSDLLREPIESHWAYPQGQILQPLRSPPTPLLPPPPMAPSPFYGTEMSTPKPLPREVPPPSHQIPYAQDASTVPGLESEHEVPDLAEVGPKTIVAPRRRGRPRDSRPNFAFRVNRQPPYKGDGASQSKILRRPRGGIRTTIATEGRVDTVTPQEDISSAQYSPTNGHGYGVGNFAVQQTVQDSPSHYPINPSYAQHHQQPMIQQAPIQHQHYPQAMTQQPPIHSTPVHQPPISTTVDDGQGWPRRFSVGAKIREYTPLREVAATGPRPRLPLPVQEQPIAKKSYNAQVQAHAIPRPPVYHNPNAASQVPHAPLQKLQNLTPINKIFSPFQSHPQLVSAPTPNETTTDAILSPVYPMQQLPGQQLPTQLVASPVAAQFLGRASPALSLTPMGTHFQYDDIRSRSPSVVPRESVSEESTTGSLPGIAAEKPRFYVGGGQYRDPPRVNQHTE